jgi:hypothetical protein
MPTRSPVCCPSEIVHELTRNPGLLASLPPPFIVVDDGVSVLVVEGCEEISRLAAQYDIARFALFDDESLSNSGLQLTDTSLSLDLCS